MKNKNRDKNLQLRNNNESKENQINMDKNPVNGVKLDKEIQIKWFSDGNRKIVINSDKGIYMRDLEQSFVSQMNAVREHNNKLARSE